MSIEHELVVLLTEKGLSVSAAESCTGGAICSTLVNVPGASRVFKEGFVTYSDEAKNRTLKVPKDVLAKFTAVSEKTAVLMAEGARAITGATLAVSVTGYAGPLGGEDGTPAGSVYIGLSGVTADGREIGFARKKLFEGDRAMVRDSSVKAALQIAIDFVKENY